MNSTDSKGYYKALGLQPGASIDEVKKAYKKKQIELHPSGPSRKKLRDSPEYKSMSAKEQEAKEAELDEQISLVNQGFTILTDEKKKAEYDSGMGEFSGFQGGFPGGGFGGFDGFADMFSHMTGGKRQSRQAKAKDIVCDLKLDFKDVFLGKKSKFRIKNSKICTKCDGKGSKDVVSCGKCKGRGSVIAKFNLGIITGSHEVECPECEGRGNISKGPACDMCHGNKVVDDSNIIEVNIKPGIESGDTIVFSKQGNESPGCVRGDIIFNIIVNEDVNNFRIGNDFITTVDLDLLTALTGGVLYYNHPDGRKLAVKVPAFKDFDNTGIVLPNEGFQGRGGKGKLYIKPHIRVNPGLDRNKLAEYIKPTMSKPSGDYSNMNSILGTVPNPYQYEAERKRNQGYERGGDMFDSDNFTGFF